MTASVEAPMTASGGPGTEGRPPDRKKKPQQPADSPKEDTPYDDHEAGGAGISVGEEGVLVVGTITDPERRADRREPTRLARQEHRESDGSFCFLGADRVDVVVAGVEPWLEVGRRRCSSHVPCPAPNRQLVGAIRLRTRAESVQAATSEHLSVIDRQAPAALFASCCSGKSAQKLTLCT